MDNQRTEIKKFWEEQAAQHHCSSLATSPDTIAYHLELAQMKKMIPTGSKVLDIGCGNGVKGTALAKEQDIDYTGLDYADEMIRQAHELLQSEKEPLRGKVRFLSGDILHSSSLPNEVFDIVMTDRCLINLSTTDNMISAVRNIHSLLQEKGIYLMFENSLQALENLNQVRRTFAMPDIQVRWHNIYIDEHKFFYAIAGEFELIETVSFASTYYLLSRTLNALLTPPGTEISYMSELNQLSAKLPSLGDFSPVKLFVLRKK